MGTTATPAERGVNSDEVVAFCARRRLTMRQLAAAIPLSTRRLRELLAPGRELRDADWRRVRAAIEALTGEKT